MYKENIGAESKVIIPVKETFDPDNEDFAGLFAYKSQMPSR